MLRREDTLSIDSFSNDAINGWIPLVKRGGLGLQQVGIKSVSKGLAMDNLTSRLPAAIKV